MFGLSIGNELASDRSGPQAYRGDCRKAGDPLSWESTARVQPSRGFCR
jgi:hypothetical protein